jgi:hypothetical protein
MRIERDLVVQDEGINKLLKCRVAGWAMEEGRDQPLGDDNAKDEKGREGGRRCLTRYLPAPILLLLLLLHLHLIPKPDRTTNLSRRMVVH